MSNLLGKYILDQDHNAIECEDVLRWGAWMETADRIVRQTVIDESLLVSTVFLGIDYSFGGPEPVLFETMVFSDYAEACCRYRTWKEAEEGHRWVCGHAHIRSLLPRVPLITDQRSWQ